MSKFMVHGKKREDALRGCSPVIEQFFDEFFGVDLNDPRIISMVKAYMNRADGKIYIVSTPFKALKEGSIWK